MSLGDSAEARKLFARAKELEATDRHRSAAVTLALRAADLFAAVGDDEMRARALSIAGTRQFMLGFSVDAESSLRLALELVPNRAETCNNLARVLEHRGLLDEALALYDRAAESLVGRPGPRARAINNRGQLAYKLGRLAEADISYQAANRELGDPANAQERRTQRHILNNQSVLLRAQGRGISARRKARLLIRLARKDQDQVQEASSWVGLARAAMDKGRTRTARNHYTKAIALSEAADDDRAVAMALHNRGILELRNRHLSASLADLSRSHSIRQRIGEPLAQTPVLISLGDAHLRLADFPNARAWYEKALAVVEELRHKIADEPTRRDLVARVGELNSKLAFVAAREGNVLDALSAHEEGRARVFKDRAAAGFAPKESRLVQRQQELLARLANEKGASESMALGSAVAPGDQLLLAAELRSIDARLNKAPAIRDQPKASDFDSRHLRVGESLVTFLTGSQGSCAFWMAAGSPDVRLAWLPPRDEIDRRTRQFSSDVQHGRRKPRHGKWLRDNLLFHAKGATYLTIVPDRGMHEIPWSALPGYRSRFLVEETIVRLSVSTLIALARRLQSRDSYKCGLIAMAAPLDAQPERASEAGPKFPAIPHTVDEVRSIEDIVKHRWKATTHVRVGNDATRDELIRLVGEFGPPKFLHLSCHGIAYPDAPMMSGVVLTGIDGKPEVWRAASILSTDLRCELAVLTSCRTAVGMPVPGEGAMSVGYLLRAAGAEAACVALWEIDDSAAASLARRFYDALTTSKDPETAMATAQRASLDSVPPADWAWAVLT